MAVHPFDTLRVEYEALLANVQITRADAVKVAADRVMRGIDRYKAVAATAPSFPPARERLRSESGIGAGRSLESRLDACAEGMRAFPVMGSRRAVLYQIRSS
jgi:hypothetical protein